jgi:Transposase
MSYRITGIDVHKKMLAVVVCDVEVDGEYQFERVRYSSSPEHLRALAERLIAHQVEEVVMESTAQYWKPVWGALERYWKPGSGNEKAQARRQEHYIWRKPNRIADDGDARKIFPMPNVW